MYTNSKLTAEDPFPEDLSVLGTEAVELLNSKVHRAVDAEVDELGMVEPETEFRLEEINSELDLRDLQQAAEEPEEAEA